MRKGIFGTFGTAALAALVNATPVDAQTPKHTAPTEAQHNTLDDIAKEVQSAGLHKLMKRIESAPQILPVVISYLNSRKSFEYHELTSLQYTFFPQLAKQPARVPSAVPLLRTYMHSVLAGDYTPESLFPGFGTVLTVLYKTNRPVYSAIAQELLESRASDEDVLRSIFSRYSRELAFVDLDTETRSKLLPGLLKRLGTIESKSVIAEYAKESTEQRTSHQFVNILDENIRLKVLESVSDSMNGDQLDSLSSEIIATAHRWATTPMLKQHLVRICRLNAFAVFKNIAMLKNIPDIDILSLIQTAGHLEDFQNLLLHHFDEYADVPGADSVLLEILASRTNDFDLADIVAFLEQQSTVRPTLTTRIQALFPRLAERLVLEAALTAQNQSTDLSRMRADPALSLAYEVPLSSIKHLVEDLTFDEQAWVSRLTRYDDYGSFYKRRSAIQLRALRSFHREQGVNPVELAHARLSVARNLLMNDLQPTQQNIASIVDDMLRTRVVRDAIPMRGATLLVTHAEMLDSDVTNGNPKGSPHFGTSAQIKALNAKSTAFAHVNGSDSNAPSAVLEKLVAAPTDLRFVFLGHGGETNDSDVAIYLSDGHALPGGKAQENASTVKIKASDFANALVRRYRRTGIDPTRDTYYFSGCQLKQYVDIIQTMLVSQGIVPPNMTAAAEHGQSNFISHDGIYGPRMDEAYILSKTWGDFRRSSTSVEFRSKPPVFSPSILRQPDGRVRFLQIGAVDAGISAVQLG